MAADPQSLLTWADGLEPRRGATAYPAVLSAENAFQLVPAAQQFLGVAGQAEIDHIVAITRIELGAIGGGQQIINAAFIGSLVSAGCAAQRIRLIADQIAVAVRTA